MIEAGSCNQPSPLRNRNHKDADATFMPHKYIIENHAPAILTYCKALKILPEPSSELLTTRQETQSVPASPYSKDLPQNTITYNHTDSTSKMDVSNAHALSPLFCVHLLSVTRGTGVDLSYHGTNRSEPFGCDTC